LTKGLVRVGGSDLCSVERMTGAGDEGEEGECRMARWGPPVGPWVGSGAGVELSCKLCRSKVKGASLGSRVEKRVDSEKPMAAKAIDHLLAGWR
jgi:hypothetical protein